MKKIYVGNLPYTIDNDQLRKYFAQAGTVVDAVVFNGKDFEGRNLVVNEARPREDSGESSGARSGSTSEPQE
ncbi:MAG: RNA-binding protein [Candidatus Woesebacteria bacterium GW2011_GWC1_42_9]|nr:MAG: RNA-binding protein [Candidatus Woesebacteria bacterium GW2011_GWC1_42_9]